MKPEILAQVMTAMGLDPMKKAYAVAMISGVVGDPLVRTDEEILKAIPDVVAYAKEHASASSGRGDGFKVEWADERLADLFFSDNRPGEWDVLTYSNKGPHKIKSLARLELHAKGRPVDSAVMAEIVAHVTGLYARRNDGAVEECKGCTVKHTFQPYSENRVRQEWEDGRLKSEAVMTHAKFENSPLYGKPMTTGSFVRNPSTGEYDAVCDRLKYKMLEPKFEPVVEKGPDGKELTITIRGEVKPKFAREADPRNPGKTRTKTVKVSEGADFRDRGAVASVMAAVERKSQDSETVDKYRPAPRQERGQHNRGNFNRPRFPGAERRSR
ncbi:MAG: hypothetical protein A3G49_05705 [Candidatus Sungbacteria bacterium RIFCSPLOWO2_12_FULL_41_11]|uniref:Uncharacterized protein n=1 Tax=Candidatus Sungbacteria bacterium RIFCSPLOWO2_12_FULL_41_11 TaxID=1802286 RepID=A0A1G2LSP3_9BACT|nr:MAG: hypothetical protein A3G49_05705 [Candidatus Sungbacteria bacterium RIFCSPLOWO2_12_FULL_41_11]